MFCQTSETVRGGGGGSGDIEVNLPEKITRQATARSDGHSSGIPASLRPAKKVSSNKARTFGAPKYPTAFKRVTLE